MPEKTPGRRHHRRPEEEGRVLRRESTGLVRKRECVLVRLGFDFKLAAGPCVYVSCRACGPWAENTWALLRPGSTVAFSFVCGKYYPIID